MSQIGRGESERARFWRELSAAWERSGQTQAAFCRARGVKAGTFAWWRRQLRRASAAAVSRPERCRRAVARFVEVPLTQSPARSGYEILLAGGRTVRVPEHFDADALSRLIATVESC